MLVCTTGHAICLSVCLSVCKRNSDQNKIHISKSIAGSHTIFGHTILDFLLNKYGKRLHSRRLFSSQHTFFGAILGTYSDQNKIDISKSIAGSHMKLIFRKTIELWSLNHPHSQPYVSLWLFYRVLYQKMHVTCANHKVGSLPTSSCIFLFHILFFFLLRDFTFTRDSFTYKINLFGTEEGPRNSCKGSVICQTKQDENFYKDLGQLNTAKYYMEGRCTNVL